MKKGREAKKAAITPLNQQEIRPKSTSIIGQS